MATEHVFHPPNTCDPGAPPSGAPLLPSQRIATPPPPGTEEAAFLENLNEVYGVEDAEDDHVIEDIRRQMRNLLGKAP